jgi:hypothetical protein
MTAPESARPAIWIATAKVAPPEMPVKMPSFRASFFDQSMATGPGTGISSS